MFTLLCITWNIIFTPRDQLNNKMEYNNNNNKCNMSNYSKLIVLCISVEKCKVSSLSLLTCFFAWSQFSSAMRVLAILAVLEIEVNINTLRLGHAMWKRVFGHMRTAKARISLHIRAFWSEPSLSANGIIGYYWIYQWRENTRLIRCACAESFSLDVAHARNTCFLHDDQC